MFIQDQNAPLEPADATAISYTLLRHLGFMLDELSAQGLTIWQDAGQRWRWAWAATAFQSEQGFWALGGDRGCGGDTASGGVRLHDDGAGRTAGGVEGQ